MIRILIADDHPIFRNGLKQIIAEEDEMVVEDEAADGKEVLSLLSKKKNYSAVVLDIEMPNMNGLDVLKQIKLSYPKLPVIILSFYPEEQYAIRALKLGASGYLTKETAVNELIDGLRSIIAGKKYITLSLAERLADTLNEGDNKAPHERLSQREFQVFCLIAKGKTASDISNALNLSPKTISTYKTRLYEKMNLNNDAQLIRYAIEEQLVKTCSSSN